MACDDDGQGSRYLKVFNAERFWEGDSLNVGSEDAVRDAEWNQRHGPVPGGAVGLQHLVDALGRSYGAVLLVAGPFSEADPVPGLRERDEDVRLPGNRSVGAACVVRCERARSAAAR